MGSFSFKFILIALVFSISACGGGGTAPTNSTSSNNTTPAPSPTPAPPTTLNSIAAGQTWKYFKGTQNPDAKWNTANFDDSAWLSGVSGFGYGDSDDATILSDMAGSYLSVYTRKSFNYSSTISISSMTLSIDYDDAYIAYLNGTEISRSSNLPAGTINFNTAASNTREAGTAVNVDIAAFSYLLVEGNNVFAIEVHNQSINSSDLSLISRIYFNEPVPSPPSGGGGGGGSSTSGSLSNYTVVSNSQQLSFISNDLSGITFVPTTGHYFLIQNNGGKIWEVDGSFNLLRTIQMSNGFGDTEDIVYLGGNEFAIVSEASKLFIVNIFSTTTTLDVTDTNNVQIITFASYSGNAGPEGVAFDSANQIFYIVKEQNPKVIYSFPRPSAGNQTITPNIPFDAEVIFSSMNDLSAITFDTRNNGSLLVLSHLSHSVMNVDINGNVLGNLALADRTQHEGITLDANFNLQITSEANIQRTYSLSP